MTDIFISYSRRDKAFVRALYEALTNLNRTAWIDWRDIAPAVEWEKTIYEGIERAISICAMELSLSHLTENFGVHRGFIGVFSSMYHRVGDEYLSPYETPVFNPNENPYKVQAKIRI